MIRLSKVKALKYMFLSIFSLFIFNYAYIKVMNDKSHEERHNSHFTCNANRNWLSVHRGQVWFAQPDRIECSAQLVRRVEDHSFTLGQIISLKHGDYVPADGFQTSCQDKLSKEEQKILYGGIRRKDYQGDEQITYTGAHYNILLLSLDSMSRLQWKRSLPNVLSEISSLSGVIFERYNIVGDGTPAAMLPLLTGLNEEELPEARRGHRGAATLDNHPWIFRRLHQLGYVTQWFEEQTAYGSFQYRMLGFKDPPVHHYMRPYNMAQEKAAQGSYCIGSESQIERQLHIIKELFHIYPDRPKFSQLHMADLSHENRDVSFMSPAFVSFLRWLKNTGHIKNTVILIFSDHGARFSHLRKTLQGRLEERLPLMSLILPQQFRMREPQLASNMEKNRNALVTPYDVHATLQHLLDITSGMHVDNQLPLKSSNRAASLLSPISMNRTCSKAGIPLHWCAFSTLRLMSSAELKSKLIQGTILMKGTRGCWGSGWFRCVLGVVLPHTYFNIRMVLVGAAAAFITFINRLTAKHRSLCAELHLKHVLSVQDGPLQSDMLKFKKSSDDRGISFAQLTNKMSGGLLQLNVMTQPNDGQYDVTVVWSKQTSSSKVDYHVELDSISRTNKYGSQAYCVERTLPYLRPICYCFK